MVDWMTMVDSTAVGWIEWLSGIVKNAYLLSC